MAEQKRVKITTRKQFDELVSFMTKNSYIAKGFKFSENFGKGAYEGKWQTITKKLNSLGPPIRNASGWQKVWNDYKLKIRKKLAHNKKELNATGGGSFRLAHLNSLEEQVANLLSLHKVAQTNARTYGVHVEQQQFDFTLENVENEDLTEGRLVLEEIEVTERQQPSPDFPERQQPSPDFPERQQPSPDFREHAQPLPEPRRKRNRPSQKEDFRKQMLEEQTESMRGITKLLDKTNKYLKNISNTLEKNFELSKKMQKKKEAEMELRMEVMEFEKKKLQLEISKM